MPRHLEASGDLSPQPLSLPQRLRTRAAIAFIAVGAAGAIAETALGESADQRIGQNANTLTVRPSINALPNAEVRAQHDSSRLVLIRRAKGAASFVKWDPVCNVHRINLDKDEVGPVSSDEMDMAGVAHCASTETGKRNGLNNSIKHPADVIVNNRFFEYGVSKGPNDQTGEFTPIGLVDSFVVMPADKDGVGKDVAYLHAIKAPGVKASAFQKVNALHVPSKQELKARDRRPGHKVVFSSYTVKSGRRISAIGTYLGHVRAKYKDGTSQDVEVLGVQGNLNNNTDPVFFTSSGSSPVNASGETEGYSTGRLNVADATVPGIDLSDPYTEKPSDAEDARRIKQSRDYFRKKLNIRLDKYETIVLLQSPQHRGVYKQLEAYRGHGLKLPEL